MEDLKIFCENDGQYHNVRLGTPLSELSEQICSTVFDEKTGTELPVLAALVDHQLKELEFKAVVSHQVEFIGYSHPDGRRTYVRSLCFVLQNAVRELYPGKVLAIEYSLPSGLYCEIRSPKAMEDGHPDVCYVTDNEIEVLKSRMQELIDADLPFHKYKMNFDEAGRIFMDNGQPDKQVHLQHIYLGRAERHILRAACPVYRISEGVRPHRVQQRLLPAVSCRGQCKQDNADETPVQDCGDP